MSCRFRLRRTSRRRVATPKYAERIAVLETKFDVLKETVEVGFQELGKKIDAASLNGQTPRVKNMSARLGDAGDVEILAEVVEERKRRAWLLSPLGIAGGSARAVLIGVTSGVLVLIAHAWLHAAVPAIP